MHNCKVENVSIKDTDFKKNEDFFKSYFKSGIKNNNKNQLEYVTLEGHSHFRNAEFKKGLDLDYVNIQNEMNFFGAIVVKKSSISQETYRIIKHNFEKLGNKIEVNSYHAVELEQKRLNLSKIKFKSIQTLSEWIVFKAHHIFSNHSSSWYIVLFWMCIVSCLTIVFLHFDIVKDLFFNPNHFKISYLYKSWHEFWQFFF